MNVDVASMNLGIHKGVGMFLKEKGPQIQVIDCFDHRVELALKGAFRTIIYIRQSKCELRELSEAYGKAAPKPSRALGTHWIQHKN